jgi:hypothetical protein
MQDRRIIFRKGYGIGWVSLSIQMLVYWLSPTAAGAVFIVLCLLGQLVLVAVRTMDVNEGK